MTVTFLTVDLCLTDSPGCSFIALDSFTLPNQDNYSSKLFTLLRSMNLERYWSIFERNEVFQFDIFSFDIDNEFHSLLQIDYLTFLSMTEQDLTQIGIEAFGIRRRLQQAIAG